MQRLTGRLKMDYETDQGTWWYWGNSRGSKDNQPLGESRYPPEQNALILVGTEISEHKSKLIEAIKKSSDFSEEEKSHKIKSIEFV